MPQSSLNLVWMDLEMSGLDPERDVIIEIACIITDSQLKVIAEGPTLAIQRPKELFDQMDDWNKKQHTHSGLWQKVLTSTVTEREAEDAVLEFIKEHVPNRTSPLCGNSIWQDRRFIARYMKQLDQYLHYRLIDVSTLKELTQRWYPEIPKYDSKSNNHRALDDIRDSIDELKHYRRHFFSLQKIQEARSE